MKRRNVIAAGCLAALVAAAVGTSVFAAPAQGTTTGTQASQTAAVTDSKTLIVYFTRAENIGGTPTVDATSSASINMQNGSAVGNLKLLADDIQSLTGGKVFSIRTESSYPQKYRSTTNQASTEQSSNARPKLSTHVDAEQWKNYETIYLGYPNWWGDMPMAVYTFLEEYDFTGKTIIPFASHEGSGLSRTVSDIQKKCTGATVLEGFSVRGGKAAAASTKSDIEAWLKKLGKVQ